MKIILSVSSIILCVVLCPGIRAGEDLVFVVREGDTVRSLTEEYLVRPTAWDRVVQYNYLLKPGNTIRVPARLVKRKGNGVLVSVYGQVHVRLAGRAGWIPAVTGLIIQKGDTVRTGLFSGAVLLAGEDDRAVLREETEVIFEPSHGFLSGNVNRVTVVEGTVLASTRKRADRETRYEIATPNAELELTGTLIRTTVSRNGESRFEVLDGEITVDLDGDRYHVPAGSGITLQP